MSLLVFCLVSLSLVWLVLFAQLDQNSWSKVESRILNLEFWIQNPKSRIWYPNLDFKRRIRKFGFRATTRSRSVHGSACDGSGSPTAKMIIINNDEDDDIVYDANDDGDDEDKDDIVDDVVVGAC